MGLRKELVEKIEAETGTEQHSIKKDELSVRTTHELYREVLDEEPQPFKGKAWHIKQIVNEKNIETYTDYHGNTMAVPTNDLKKIMQYL